MMAFSGGVTKPSEPTQDQVKHFLECLKKVPPSYFSGYKDPMSADYGTLYTSCYVVVDWLRFKFGVD